MKTQVPYKAENDLNNPRFHFLVHTRDTWNKVIRRYLYQYLEHYHLLAIGKRWKYLKFPSMDEGIKKNVYIHVMEYLLFISEKKENSNTKYNIDESWTHKNERNRKYCKRIVT